jgi:hypothetical protein
MKSLVYAAGPLLLAVGCHPGEDVRPAAPQPTMTVPALPQGPTPTSSTSNYEVHEWGLLRGEAGDVIRVGAVSPPLPPSLTAVDKPVLYFWPDTPLRLDKVMATMPSGTVVETWPLAQLGAQHETATWLDVELDPKGACDPSPLPTADDPPCNELDGAFCESAGLAEVRAPDAACVRAHGTTDRFLFYRAEAHAFTPPLRFARKPGSPADVTITNDSAWSIPGVIVRIHADAGSTRTSVAAPPRPHRSISMASPLVTSDIKPAVDKSPVDESDAPYLFTGEGRQGLLDSLHSLGLRPSEIDAFMNAWSPTLFGPTTRDEDGVDRSPAPRESFLYFLPAQAIENVSRLELTPPPRAVRRAFAVWATLRPSGDSR